MHPISRSICRSCRLKLQLKEQGRSLTTSARRSNIPPEAPNYIDIPLSHQPELIIPTRPKGILPVPRELFPAKRPDKPSAQYIRNVTMDKLPKNVKPMTEMSELKQHRTRMTEVRKKNLREGLTELHERKESMGRRIAERSDYKQRERAALVAQPERENARLTNVSIPSAMVVKATTQASREHAEAVYREKEKNVQKHIARKEEARRDALHTLYMNARSFITTEEQLKEEIEREFSPTKWDLRGGGRELNIWSTGEPQTIGEMLVGADPRAKRDNFNDNSRKVDKDQERMKRIAEELSGGRM